MASDSISTKFKDLKINESQDINILLLGETGVGKSTFINSIANYLHFKSFKKAANADELLVLIPSVMTVTNENFEQVTINIGSDNNEFQEIGAAGTQDVKTYVFPIGEGKTRLRLIDSPGVGDPRGIEQDDINCENILTYLSQLKELHAICFLMKPTNTRKTILFEYCVKQILSRLEKSASKNIIFIFTNTRGSNYSPGDTLPCLKTIIDEIKSKPPNVDIPLKSNIFSFDNESFRYLVAMKKGIKFNEDVKLRFIESWTKSSAECWRLISYIIGDGSHDPLKPHQLQNTMSINEARRIIVHLSQPLADITQLIHDNIRILEKHKRNLEMDNQSLDDLKKKLFIPIVSLEVTQLTQPVTVCTSTKCADMVQVGEIRKWHYRQRCHDPCYLTNVTAKLVGDTNLIHCAAMSGTTCARCTCNYSVHMHIYYMTKTVNDKIVDNVVQGNINRKEQAVAESRRLISEIDRRKVELEEERQVIIRSTAQFAHFLQHNAISPFNDSYKSYIDYLITREKSLGRNGDPEVIHSLEQLLCRYEEIKAAFDNSLSLNQQYQLDTIVTSTVTAQSVMSTIHQLYKLKHNGKKIHELLKKQKASRNTEYDKSCEYVHPKTSDMSQSESKKNKKEKKSSKKSDDSDRKEKDKKSSKKSDDSDRKEKDKKKDGKNSDVERRNKTTQNRNYSHPGNSYGRNQNTQFPTRMHNRDPPPPYPGQPYADSRSYKAQHNSSHYGPEEPNIVLKVELNQSGKERQGRSEGHRYQDPNYHHPRYESYPGPPQTYNQTPPPLLSPHIQGAPYHPPYYGEPHRPPYQPDPRPVPSPYPDHGAPPTSYYERPFPAPNQHNERYGPPHEQFRPPQGPGYGPPQGQYYPPTGHTSHYQKRPPGPGGPPHHHQGNRGHNYKRGGGNTRNHSKPRYSSKKSGKEKKSSSSSSDSDSSSD